MAKKSWTFLMAVLWVVTLFPWGSAFAAEGSVRYQLVTVKDGDATYTYMIDTEKGEVSEVKLYKSSRGSLEHYLKTVPQFEKDKEVNKWITEMEKVPVQ